MHLRSTRIAQVCALLLLPLGLLGGLSACQTRLTGSRTPDYDLPRGVHSGIPFRLARPVFFIQQTTKKNDKQEEVPTGIYQLVVEYRSDPSAVYWVNVSPAEFHESRLALSFASAAVTAGFDDPSSHGFLTGLDLEGKNQSSGFLQAIGQFAVDAVGLYVLARSTAEIDRQRAAGGAALVALGNSYRAFGFKDSDEALDRIAEILLRKGMDVPGFVPGAPETAESIKGVLRPLPPGTAPKDAQLAALQARALERLASSISEDLRRFHVITGIDLLRLYTLYQEFSSLGEILREALIRPGVLPGQQVTARELDALKDDIRAQLTVHPMLGNFQLERFHVATAQALLSLLIHHRFLDALDIKRVQPSPEYLGVEERLFGARHLRTAWEERRRLKAFLQSGTEIYSPPSVPAPDVGFVHELEKASKRVTDIDALLVANIEQAVQWTPPPDLVVKDELDAPDFGPWVGKKLDRRQPRWVYQEHVPGPTQERGKWLRKYLADRQPPGCEPEEGELVVLVERSYPDREVLPNGGHLGLVSEVKLAPTPTTEPCPKPPPSEPPCKPAWPR